jgi:hypothetical protein
MHCIACLFLIAELALLQGFEISLQFRMAIYQVNLDIDLKCVHIQHVDILWEVQS